MTTAEEVPLAEQAADALWGTSCFEFSKAERKLEQQLRDRLTQSKTALGCYLVDLSVATSAAHFTRSDVAALQKIVGGKSPKRGQTSLLLHMLNKVMWYAGRFCQADIPLPRLYGREIPNPYTDSLPAQQRVAAWLQAEATWIRDLAPSGSGDTEAVRNVPVALFRCK